MKNEMLSNKRLFVAPGLKARGRVSGMVRSCGTISFAAIALIAIFSVSQIARADTAYNFSVNGSGIAASGVLTVSNTGPLGASTVTGISGTFSDSNNGISGAITGLEFAPAPTFNTSPPSPPNTFGAPAFTDAGLSYDNLFWPGADSPAVCQDALAFFGGYFDVYGVAFDIAGGYKADMWSNGALGGYQINDSLNGVTFIPSNFDGLAYAVNVNATPTPEPGSLLLVGTGLSGVAALWRRRKATV